MSRCPFNVIVYNSIFSGDLRASRGRQTRKNIFCPTSFDSRTREVTTFLFSRSPCVTSLRFRSPRVGCNVAHIAFMCQKAPRVTGCFSWTYCWVNLSPKTDMVSSRNAIRERWLFHHSVERDGNEQLCQCKRETPL